MPKQRIVKYPPKRGQLSKSKVERAVKEVLEARGVRTEPKCDTYKYHLKRGNKIIRSGITNNLDRREKEHQRELLEARGVRTEPKCDTYKYHLKRGNKIIRSGITNNLDRREKEHQRELGDNVQIQQVGTRTTREGAREWEKKQRRGTL